METIDEISVENSADARAQPRSSLFLAAVLEAGVERSPAKVRNMSPNGAMIESPITPPVGTAIRLMRGELIAQGVVIWSLTNRCGVLFSSKISIKEWLAAPSKAQQQRVDDMVALVKAGGSSGHGEAIADGPRSHAQLVDDLAQIVKLMQGLEDELSSSTATLERHGSKLQNIDIAMQMLRAVAAELDTTGSGAPQSKAKLRDLRVSCAEALGKR